ncbi:hypothetical protein Tco_1325716, partial [Tanacetum coccineum]
KNAATVANKEAVVDSMLSNQFVQHQLHMPSLATHDSPDLLESSSRFVKRKREPTEDPKTSQVLPGAKSKKVRASIGADHRKQLVAKFLSLFLTCLFVLSVGATSRSTKSGSRRGKPRAADSLSG